MDDRCLHEEFLPFGAVISAKVMMENGCSRGAGFVSFSSPDEARKAIVEMNGRLLGSRQMYVSPAQSKEEHQGRDGERTDSTGLLNLAQIHTRLNRTSGHSASPSCLILVVLFVKNLDYSMDDRHLHEAFVPFGTVISAKVMMENSRSRGIGFVCYSSPDEATKAIRER
ncbi:hypothetical protein PHYPO_G00236000 [Pangasianodon hypophthalmus]|uniref:RRM domain-containing protein n=1 Tax=Pangasianodon hypophthalmus TaxID=310915 RepID=A0A5N5NJJ1_PANHP|nr:hypothetical protein PHYPO_G00236000 [Pangasianodon hypophthalmus]